jgi:hypothetical protein
MNRSVFRPSGSPETAGSQLSVQHFGGRLAVAQPQTQRTLLDWLRVEYAIAKPSNKLLALTELDSDTWLGEVKRIRGKKQPLSAAGVQGLRAEYTRSIEPARALPAETLNQERALVPRKSLL